MSTTPTPAPTPTPTPATATPLLSPARTLATAARVLRQLSHDPRTIALLLLIPVLMITLLRYVFDGTPAPSTPSAPRCSASSR